MRVICHSGTTYTYCICRVSVQFISMDFYASWCAYKMLSIFLREKTLCPAQCGILKNRCWHSFTYKLKNMSLFSVELLSGFSCLIHFTLGCYLHLSVIWVQESKVYIYIKNKKILLDFTCHQKFPGSFSKWNFSWSDSKDSLWVLMINFTFDVPVWMYYSACFYQDFWKVRILQSRYGDHRLIDGREILCYAPSLRLERPLIVAAPAGYVLNDKSTFSHTIITSIWTGPYLVRGCPQNQLIFFFSPIRFNKASHDKLRSWAALHWAMILNLLAVYMFFSIMTLHKRWPNFVWPLKINIH